MMVSKLLKWLTFSGLLAVFFLVLYRSAYVALTTDEAFFYLNFVKGSWSRVFFLDGFVSANNHFPLAILLKLIFTKLSISEFSLRAPSVIALVTLIVFIFRRQKQIDFSYFLLFSAFVFSSQLAVDLFSLARGYGISFCLLIAHFYYLGLFSGFAKGEVRNMNKAILFILIAISFNFNLILYFVSFGLVLFVSEFREQRFGMHTFIAFFIKNRLMFLFLLFLFPVYQLIVTQQLYFGGQNSIYEDSLLSVFHGGWTNQNPLLEGILMKFKWVVVIIGFLAIFIDSFFVFLKKQSIWENYWGITFGLCLLIEWMQHLVFNTPFLLDRTALIYWFLFAGILSSMINRFTSFLSNEFKPLLISFLSVFLFAIAFMIPKSSSRTWYNDASNKEILPFLLSDSAHGGPISIDNEWIYEPGLNYYRELFSLTDKIKEFDREEFLTMKDEYYVVSGGKVDRFKTSDFLLLKHYEVSDTYIYKRNPAQNEK